MRALGGNWHDLCKAAGEPIGDQPDRSFGMTTMTSQTAPAAAHRDNLLGICHALGETFGFNPLYLRLLLLVGIMLDARLALIAYAVAGIAVLAAKLATHPWAGRRTSVHSLITA